MDYQVWTKDEYEGWKKVDCDGLETAQEELMKALLTGKDPLLTVTVPFDFNIKIKEDKIGEATKDKAEPDKGAGGKSHGKVRRGDEAVAPGLDKGTGDLGAGPSAGNKQ